MQKLCQNKRYQDIGEAERLMEQKNGWRWSNRFLWYAIKRLFSYNFVFLVTNAEFVTTPHTRKFNFLGRQRTVF